VKVKRVKERMKESEVAERMRDREKVKEGCERVRERVSK
jgi:hypothetical protein